VADPGVAAVAAADDLVDEERSAARSSKSAVPCNSSASAIVRLAVRALDRPVLLGDAAIVAGGQRAVMCAEVLVPPGQFVPRIAVEITEVGRQAVGPILPRCAAERPQGILQPFGQCDEALATEHDMGVLEPAIAQPEVIGDDRAACQLRPCR